MTNSSEIIRQAALVLARLERDARDAVLEEMPAEQAAKIRCLLLNQDAEDEVAQEAAIREFLSTQQFSRSSQVDKVERVFELSRDDGEGHVASSTQRMSPMDNLTSSLRDLLQHLDSTLADILRLERPATVAALLSAIPGFRAAAILRHVPSELRTRVLMILNSGVDPHPKAIEAISEWICDHLAECRLEPKVGFGHRSAVEAILDEFSLEEREAMLADLAQENPMLARRLASSASNDAAHDCYC